MIGATDADAPLLYMDGVAIAMNDGQRSTTVTLDNCCLRPGLCHALVGPSGIGKTTALEMLALVRRPTTAGRARLRDASGEIDLSPLIAHGDTSRLDRLRASHFGYVVQASPLLPFLTLRQNAGLSQRLCGRVDEAYLDDLLDLFDLKTLANAYPADLSGGQRQRVGVARALAHRPPIILADEPTSAVDAELAREIVSALVSYAEEFHAAVLVVTHNIALADAFGLPRIPISSTVSEGEQRTFIGEPVHSSSANPQAMVLQ